MANELIVAQDGGVLTLTLNRPERRNALSLSLYELLLTELERAAADDAVGAIVLTGAGGAFCAGGDVARMAGTPAASQTLEQKVADLRRRTRIVELLHGMRKPTIAKMRGAAAGAGLSIALACDMRIADTSVRLTTGFVKVGLSGDFGGHYFLPRLVGAAKARELYLLSPLLPAEEALRLGLVNRIIEPDALDGEVDAMARTLASGPRTAIGYLKDNLNQDGGATLAQVLDAECLRHGLCSETADHREAAQAFVEKRAPRFGQAAGTP